MEVNMFCLKDLFVAKKARMLVVILALAFCLPASHSYAQDDQPPAVFTGKDLWKNKYIKRAQEVSKLKRGTATRQPASETLIREFDLQSFNEMRRALADLTSESEKPDPERELLKKYVKSY